MKKYTINDMPGRANLGEGVTYGMSFSLLYLSKNSRKESIFEALNPSSPCKDYLNEVIFSERFGVPSSAYGFSYEPKNFKPFSGQWAYLGLKMSKNKNNEHYLPSRCIKKDTQILLEKNAVKLINKIEKMLKVKRLTKMFSANNDKEVLVKFSTEWVQNTPSISLFTLLLRVGMFYDKDDDPIKFLENFTEIRYDVGLIKGMLPRLKFFIKKGQVPGQSYRPQTCDCPHNNGILSVDINNYYEYA